MGRRSSITQLDPRIKGAVDAAIRDGRASIDEIVDLVDRMGEELGTGDTASRSAVGRYRQTAERELEMFRAAQEVSSVWTKEIGESPESDSARLANQVLSAVALNTARSLVSSGEAVPAGEVMFLAKALDHLAKAEANKTATILRVRKEMAQKAADTAVAAGRRAGVSAEALEMIRREVYGIVDAPKEAA